MLHAEKTDDIQVPNVDSFYFVLFSLVDFFFFLPCCFTSPEEWAPHCPSVQQAYWTYPHHLQGGCLEAPWSFSQSYNFHISYDMYMCMKPLMSAILTLWHLLNLWHKTDLGGPTWVIMQGLLSLFMNLILVGMLGRHAESCVHRVVRQMIVRITIIL